MNLKKQLLIAFLISFVSLLGFGLIALLVSKHTIITFDSTIISYVQGFEVPWLTKIMKVFTFIGSTVPAGVIMQLEKHRFFCRCFSLGRLMNGFRQGAALLTCIVSTSG